MVLDARAIAHAGEPEVDDARFTKAGDHADTVDDHRNQQHPPRLKDQEQFDRDNRVDDKEGVGNARKHLRARERYKQSVSFQVFAQRVFHCSNCAWVRAGVIASISTD